MTDLYNEELLNSTAKQLKHTALKVIALFLAFILVSIFVGVLVSNTLGMLVLVLGVSLCLLFWGIYGTPVFGYYRFIKDILLGKSRKVHAVITKVSDQPIYKDNKLYFYEIIVVENDTERLLLFDSNLSEFKFELSQSYTFEVHDNYITNISP